jgi:hypothetical protein
VPRVSRFSRPGRQSRSRYSLDSFSRPESLARIRHQQVVHGSRRGSFSATTIDTCRGVSNDTTEAGLTFHYFQLLSETGVAGQGQAPRSFLTLLEQVRSRHEAEDPSASVRTYCAISTGARVSKSARHRGTHSVFVPTEIEVEYTAEDPGHPPGVNREHGFGPNDVNKILDFIHNSPAYRDILTDPIFANDADYTQ